MAESTPQCAAIPSIVGEVASAAVPGLLSLYMLDKSLDAFEDYRDRMYDIANRTMVKAEELTASICAIRARDNSVFGEINSLPEYSECEETGRRMLISNTKGIAREISNEMRGIDKYHCGSRNEIATEAGKQFVERGLAGIGRGYIFETLLEDRYYERKWSSMTSTSNASYPNISSGIASSADIFAGQAQLAGQRVNSSLAGAFNSGSQLIQTFNNRTPEVTPSPLMGGGPSGGGF